MQKTFEELTQLDFMVGELYKKNPELKETKFGYAYTKFYKKNYLPILSEFQEEIHDNRSDHALEDEKTKAIIRDEKSPTGYAHTKSELKECRRLEKFITDKYDAKVIECEPYISVYIPEGLNETQLEMLSGLLMK